MKTLHVVIAAMFLGVVSAVGVSWARFGGNPPFVLAVDPAAAAASGHPKVSVDTRHFEFGTVERGKVTHVFHLANSGGGLLKLEAGPTSCSKCTIANLSKNALAPGETAEVAVEYTVTHGQRAFQQRATVLTNDPEQPRVELNIYGTVKSGYQIDPDHLILSRIAVNETTTTLVSIYDFSSQGLEVISKELMDPETAKFFELAIEPMPSEKMQQLKAQSGCMLRITMKPGLPLGPLRQTIRLELKLGGSDDNPHTEFVITGTVVSDMSIVGPGWNSDESRLSFPHVKSEEGSKRTLSVLVRGEHRREVQLEPIKVDPSWLKVTVGEPTELNESVMQFPLTIEIPPGTQPTNHSGTDQGKYAEVVLGVKNHPDIHEFPLHLRFVVEK